VKKTVFYSFLILLTALIADCKKELTVESIADIPGTWRWEYLCGGPRDTCFYMSSTKWATIQFGADGSYLEKRNDTIFLQTTYEILGSEGTFGTLVLESPYQSYPITVMNGMLLITRLDYMDSYRKIKD